MYNKGNKRQKGVRKMNKDEIKKGLTVCAGDSCDSCSYYKFHNCYDRLKLDARSLIIEQEKKIEKLKAENRQLKTECALLDDELRIARQDTIDVLNKLKDYVNQLACDEYGDSACDTNYITIDIDKYEQDIDEMIAEIKKCRR